MGSIAFVIGSALTGKLVSLYDYRMILVMLSVGIASMLLGMLLKPSVQPQGESRQPEAAGLAAWLTLVRQSWCFLACVCLLQARTPHTTDLALSTGRKRGIPPPPWATCGRLASWRKW